MGALYEDYLALGLTAALALFWGGGWGVLLFLALRWPTLGESERRAAALVSASIAPWYAFAAGDELLIAPRSGVVLALALLTVVLLWLRNLARGGGVSARAVAWLALGAALFGMVERTFSAPGLDLWGYGVVRILGAAILAYAIVRHQLLGIDLKVRFALSKSTIAAVFIAVFFVTTEAAQQFFGEQFESGYLGILAAGALVFAIAPLSRVADRLAERAVPIAMSPVSREENAPPGRTEGAFARAVRLALRGGITRREEHDLAALADTMGLSAKRALEIREMLEEEVAR